MKKFAIQVFEYESRQMKEEGLMDALEAFYGEKGVPYYDLIRGGVRFKQFVGVLKVGKYTIEVLPKTDKTSESKEQWQSVLIDMIKQSGIFKTDVPSSASLKLKSNNILEVYIERFISECEALLHRGLIKRYRKEEGNRLALKGALVFGKHISKNSTHKERFYVRHTVYDVEHTLNQILYKTIRILPDITSSPLLTSRIASLSISFPELDDVVVSDNLFERIVFDRKSEHYQQAISIAKLLLLNYHPDISIGKSSVLALMFDMNDLWEKWVLRQLQKLSGDDFKVRGQRKETFWNAHSEDEYSKTLRPDIVIHYNEKTIILDTKWKLPKDDKPSDEDLRQMFAYNKLFQSQKSILVYPGKRDGYSGSFFKNEEHGHCEVYFLDVIKDGKLVADGIDKLIQKIAAIGKIASEVRVPLGTCEDK